jgi:DNA-damage-inducible protein D
MTDSPVSRQHHASFEGLRQLDDAGNEYWLARKLATALDYSQYRHFLPAIERARIACEQSGQAPSDHFEDVLTMVDIGSGAKRQIEDIRLSRYVCYLIVQNGDPSKPVIANGQTYFAIQTRRQELANDTAFGQLSEDEKRLAIRNELAQHNKYLLPLPPRPASKVASTSPFSRTMAIAACTAGSVPRPSTLEKA